MNDSTVNELKAVVERAVQPIRATVARKRRMREDLLAHLVAIFEQEKEENGGGEQAAIEEAKQRFGDTQELTGQLQQSVSRWDRCWSVFENLGCRPNESAARFAARHFLLSMLVLTPTLPIYAIAHGWRGYAVAVMLLVSALTGALVNVILSMISATLLDRFGRVLVSTLRGRIVLAVCGVAAACGLLMHPFFWVAVLPLFLMVRQEFQKWHYQTAWA